MEYIEREKLLSYLNDIWLFATPTDLMPDDDRQLAMARCMGLNDAMDTVKEAPAADVRPVVLCKDCKYWKQWDNTTHYLCTYVAGAKFIRNAEDFCSRGEKREES